MFCRGLKSRVSRRSFRHPLTSKARVSDYANLFHIMRSFIVGSQLLALVADHNRFHVTQQ